jgi:hypothetical protein
MLLNLWKNCGRDMTKKKTWAKAANEGEILNDISTHESFNSIIAREKNHFLSERRLTWLIL